MSSVPQTGPQRRDNKYRAFVQDKYSSPEERKTTKKAKKATKSKKGSSSSNKSDKVKQPKKTEQLGLDIFRNSDDGKAIVNDDTFSDYDLAAVLENQSFLDGDLSLPSFQVSKDEMENETSGTIHPPLLLGKFQDASLLEDEDDEGASTEYDGDTDDFSDNRSLVDEKSPRNAKKGESRTKVSVTEDLGLDPIYSVGNESEVSNEMILGLSTDPTESSDATEAGASMLSSTASEHTDSHTESDSDSDGETHTFDGSTLASEDDSDDSASYSSSSTGSHTSGTGTGTELSDEGDTLDGGTGDDDTLKSYDSDMDNTMAHQRPPMKSIFDAGTRFISKVLSISYDSEDEEYGEKNGRLLEGDIVRSQDTDLASNDEDTSTADGENEEATQGEAGEEQKFTTPLFDETLFQATQLAKVVYKGIEADIVKTLVDTKQVFAPAKEEVSPNDSSLAEMKTPRMGCDAPKTFSSDSAHPTDHDVVEIGEAKGKNPGSDDDSSTAFTSMGSSTILHENTSDRRSQTNSYHDDDVTPIARLRSRTSSSSHDDGSAAEQSPIARLRSSRSEHSGSGSDEDSHIKGGQEPPAVADSPTESLDEIMEMDELSELMDCEAEPSNESSSGIGEDKGGDDNRSGIGSILDDCKSGIKSELGVIPEVDEQEEQQIDASANTPLGASTSDESFGTCVSSADRFQPLQEDSASSAFGSQLSEATKVSNQVSVDVSKHVAKHLGRRNENHEEEAQEVQEPEIRKAETTESSGTGYSSFDIFKLLGDSGSSTTAEKSQEPKDREIRKTPTTESSLTGFGSLDVFKFLDPEDPTVAEEPASSVPVQPNNAGGVDSNKTDAKTNKAPRGDADGKEVDPTTEENVEVSLQVIPAIESTGTNSTGQDSADVFKLLDNATTSEEEDANSGGTDSVQQSGSTENVEVSFLERTTTDGSEESNGTGLASAAIFKLLDDASSVVSSGHQAQAVENDGTRHKVEPASEWEPAITDTVGAADHKSVGASTPNDDTDKTRSRTPNDEMVQQNESSENVEVALIKARSVAETPQTTGAAEQSSDDCDRPAAATVPPLSGVADLVGDLPEETNTSSTRTVPKTSSTEDVEILLQKTMSAVESSQGTDSAGPEPSTDTLELLGSRSNSSEKERQQPHPGEESETVQKMVDDEVPTEISSSVAEETTSYDTGYGPSTIIDLLESGSASSEQPSNTSETVQQIGSMENVEVSLKRAMTAESMAAKGADGVVGATSFTADDELYRFIASESDDRTANSETVEHSGSTENVEVSIPLPDPAPADELEADEAVGASTSTTSEEQEEEEQEDEDPPPLSPFDVFRIFDKLQARRRRMRREAARKNAIAAGVSVDSATSDENEHQDDEGNDNDGAAKISDDEPADNEPEPAIESEAQQSPADQVGSDNSSLQRVKTSDSSSSERSQPDDETVGDNGVAGDAVESEGSPEEAPEEASIDQLEEKLSDEEKLNGLMADLDYLFGSALGMGTKQLKMQQPKKEPKESVNPSSSKSTDELIDLFSEPTRVPAERRVVVSTGFSSMADFFPTSNIEWLDYATGEKEDTPPPPPAPQQQGPVVVDLLSDGPIDSVIEQDDDDDATTASKSIATEESIETQLEEPEVDLIGVSDMIRISEVPAPSSLTQNVDEPSIPKISPELALLLEGQRPDPVADLLGVTEAPLEPATEQQAGQTPIHLTSAAPFEVMSRDIFVEEESPSHRSETLLPKLAVATVEDSDQQGQPDLVESSAGSKLFEPEESANEQRNVIDEPASASPFISFTPKNEARNLWDVPFDEVSPDVAKPINAASSTDNERQQPRADESREVPDEVERYDSNDREGSDDAEHNNLLVIGTDSSNNNSQDFEYFVNFLESASMTTVGQEQNESTTDVHHELDVFLQFVDEPTSSPESMTPSDDDEDDNEDDDNEDDDNDDDDDGDDDNGDDSDASTVDLLDGNLVPTTLSDDIYKHPQENEKQSTVNGTLFSFYEPENTFPSANSMNNKQSTTRFVVGDAQPLRSSENFFETPVIDLLNDDIQLPPAPAAPVEVVPEKKLLPMESTTASAEDPFQFLLHESDDRKAAAPFEIIADPNNEGGSAGNVYSLKTPRHKNSATTPSAKKDKKKHKKKKKKNEKGSEGQAENPMDQYLEYLTPPVNPMDQYLSYLDPKDSSSSLASSSFATSSSSSESGGGGGGGSAAGDENDPEIRATASASTAASGSVRGMSSSDDENSSVFSFDRLEKKIHLFLSSAG